ncbi:hypothetical protein [Stieleria mannarensis]|uniref:hypothetical protein n=1 Tax=Stieleria mannarensis TaxID=2755585 RepID=UPI001601AC5D|nr:hypothetical protein [Rhodopirellula sp. JC639]
MIRTRFCTKALPQVFTACLIALTVVHAAGGTAGGQDPAAPPSPHRVRLSPSLASTADSPRRWYPRPLTTLDGTIVTFDADQLSILIGDQNAPTRVASARVNAIEWRDAPADQIAALDLFHQGDFAAALPALVRCISDHDASSRPPVWRQQWLSMMAAQAAMRSGRGDIALELVRQLDARPLPLMILGILPIDWTGSVGDDQAFVQTAAKHAASDSLAVKLVVASWLLRSPKYRGAAEAALVRLAGQQDRKTIALLAKQLTHLTKSPPAIKSNLRLIEAEIEQLPMALQTAPMVCLLNLVQQSGLEDAAKKWKLMLELAAPTWHPDLPAAVATP